MSDHGAMSTPDEYDRHAAAWLRNRVPGASPDLGSVKFVTDCAAYASGGWAKVHAEWTEGGAGKSTELIDDAWEADLTTIIRELLATEPEP